MPNLSKKSRQYELRLFITLHYKTATDKLLQATKAVILVIVKSNQTVSYTKQELQAVIITRNHLVGYHLALKLSENHLTTRLYHQLPSKVSFPFFEAQVHQENLSPHTPLPESDYYLLVYPTLSDLDLLQQIAKLSVSTSAKVLVIGNYRQLQEINSFIDHAPASLDLRLIILTDPYGPYFLGSHHDPLGISLSAAQNRQPLVLANNGQDDLFPTYIADLTPIILKTLFTSGTVGSVYWLSTLEATKHLDLAYQLVNLNSELTGFTPAVELQEGRQGSQVNLQAIASSQSLLNWQPTTENLVGLRSTLQVSAPPPEPLPVQAPPPKPKLDLAKLPPIERKVRRFFSPKAWGIIGAITIFFLLYALPIILFGLNSYLGARHLTSALTQLGEGNTKQSKQLAQTASANFASARVLLQSGGYLFFFVPSDKLSKYDRLLDSGSRLSEVVITSSDTVVQAEELYKIILGASTGDFTESTTKLKTLLESLYGQLSLVKASLDKVDVSSRLEFFQQLESAQKKLPEMLQELQLGLSSLDLLPRLINTPQTQTYLVLFQNNAELRPTGGFIGSFALMTFQNGRLIDLKVEDVYNADGQLAGHVEPPGPLKKYLGEASWYLRDSNWYPHFPATAKQIQWFVEKEINVHVSGVIGINLYTVKDLLVATGGLELPEFQETITADNLFERAEYRSEVNFFPGSTQKRDFIASLADKLLVQIKSGQVPLSKLVKAFNQSLEQGQVIISVNDESAQQILEKLNWTGSLVDPPCPDIFTTAPCTSQTFAIIEANLGVNKSNYFLERSINHLVYVEKEGQLNYQISVNYKNNSPSIAWPGGIYKTYTRFYLPLGSQITSAQLNGQDITPEFDGPSPEIGLHEVAFWYEVAPGQSAQLQLQLRSEQILATKSPNSSLNINWQKQSGTGPDPISLIIDYPQYLRPDQISLPADSQPQKLIFNSQLQSDMSFDVLFQHQ